MKTEFDYKGESFQAVAIEAYTRWQGECSDCGHPFTFVSRGAYEPPAYPVRRCRDCRRNRRQTRDNKKLMAAVIAATDPPAPKRRGRR
jgi:hypothetical protein